MTVFLTIPSYKAEHFFFGFEGGIGGMDRIQPVSLNSRPEQMEG